MATTGLEFNLWVFAVDCPSCGESILLPRQSPLGRFDGQADPSKGAWPAEFLCQNCGHGFFATRAYQRPMLSLLTESSFLLRIEYKGGPSNFEKQGATHTAYSSFFPQYESLQKARAYIQATYGPEAWTGNPEDYPW